MSKQVEFISLEDLVSLNHDYRHFISIFDFRGVSRELRSVEKEAAYKGYGALRLFKCLLLQFMEDLSDRELMKFLSENNSAKWFCDFGLTEKTPDYSVFSRMRYRIGTKRLSKIFSQLRDQLSAEGYMSEVFTFVDASHLISKASLWAERDKAIALRYEQLNNKSLPKVSHDKQARLGCKGKNKFWYGYKKHISVDMQSGLINKVAVTPANKTDAEGLKHVCPDQGAVYADKGYCINPARRIAKIKDVHLCAIKKNNMKDKNKSLDYWFTHLRSPYERVFSKQTRRTRYVGVCKNQFSEFMYAICFNLRRMLRLKPPLGAAA